MGCKHKWMRFPDYWECSNCFTIKRIIRDTAMYWDKDGKRITLIEDGGEEDIALIEEELKKLRKK